MSVKLYNKEQDVITFLRGFQSEIEFLSAAETLKNMGWKNPKATIRMVPAKCRKKKPLTSDEEEYIVTIVDFENLYNGKIRYKYVDEEGNIDYHMYDPVVEHERQQEKLEPLFRIH